MDLQQTPWPAEEQECMSGSQKERYNQQAYPLANTAPTTWQRFRHLCKPPPWSETLATNVTRLSSCPTRFQSWKPQQEKNSQRVFMRSHSTDEQACSGYQPTVVFQKMKTWMSSPHLESKEDSKTKVIFQEKKTLLRAALEQRTERVDFHFLKWWQQVVVMTEITHGPQPTQCRHVKKK